MLFCYLFIVNLIFSVKNLYSLKFTLPDIKKSWHGHFTNFDIYKPSHIIEARHAFQSCSILTFDIQQPTMNSVLFMDMLISICDSGNNLDIESITKGKNVNHFFQQSKTVPHIALRGYPNDPIPTGEMFKYGLLWHQDLVGTANHKQTVFSALQFDTVPFEGGNTMFANINHGISRMNIPHEWLRLKCQYTQDVIPLITAKYSPCGIERIFPRRVNETKGLISQSLFRYNDRNIFTLSFTPVRFYKFEGYSVDESWRIITHIMNKYILTEDNIVNIKWKANQVGIFRNDELIHTSTPTKIYQGEPRQHRLAFIPPKKNS